MPSTPEPDAAANRAPTHAMNKKIDNRDRSKTRQEIEMNANPVNQKNSKRWDAAVLAVVAMVAGTGLTIRALQSEKPVFASSPVNIRTTAAADVNSNAGAASAEITFASPDAAGAALGQAMSSGDLAQLTKVIGTDATALVTSNDAVSDQTAMRQFFIKYQQMNRWVAMSDGSQVLYIGTDNFAFPVPLAKNASGAWYFDAVAGAQEIRARDIGRNELLTIDAIGTIASAQEIYQHYRPEHEFAQQIVSSAGMQNGLYWPASDALGISPIGYLDQFAASSLASVSPDKPFVVDGYTIRILTSQGADAKGGAKNYIVAGKLTGGFALIATPVKYGETGIMSFIVGRNGKIYERDFGPDTAKLTASITAYNPDDNWSRIE
jgi:Protein of unknown function (DUF2950)